MDNTREKLIELIKKPIAIMPGRIGTPHITFTMPYAEELADHLIANGVTVQEWISVKDRLPEVADTYLVVIKYKYDWEKECNIDTDVASYNPYEGGYIDNCWNTYNDWDEGQQYIHVTHWMPLPQPPKGE